MEVAEKRMLRWMRCVTREDRISNARIRGTGKKWRLRSEKRQNFDGTGTVMRSGGKSAEKSALNVEMQGRTRE